jgi:hypothetical protein
MELVDWDLFRKVLDGTFESLNSICIDRGSYYLVTAESWGGLQLQCRIEKPQPPSAEQVDYETHFKGKTPTSRRTADGLPRQASEKPTDPKANTFSINLCDRTTWFPDAARITDEVLVPTGLQAQLANTFIIDLTHGKVTNEHLVEGASGLVVRRADNSVMVERRWHEQNLFIMGKIPSEPAYDYECNYATGLITFQAAPPPGVKASYSYARTSKTVIEPPAGQDLQIISVEVNFSDDVEMLDTVVFQPYVYNPADLPNKVPYGDSIQYKTVWDLIAESNGACPEIQSICSAPNLRGMGGRKARILNWAYATKTALSSAVGAELRLSLEHDFPFDGRYAVVTFYGVLKPTPN